jgi:hypothetical protein
VLSLLDPIFVSAIAIIARKHQVQDANHTVNIFFAPTHSVFLIPLIQCFPERVNNLVATVFPDFTSLLVEKDVTGVLLLLKI